MDFGCVECFGDDSEDPATVMSRCLRKTNITQYLGKGMSSEVIQLRRCDACSQWYVAVFLQDIDWDGGLDSEDDTVLPITPAEAEALVTSRNLRADIEELGTGRRWLYHERPVGSRQETHSWGKGAFTLRETR